MVSAFREFVLLTWSEKENGRQDFLSAVPVVGKNQANSCLSMTAVGAATVRATTVGAATMRATAVGAATVELSPSVTAEPAVGSASEASAIKLAPLVKTVFPAFEATPVKAGTTVETGPPIEAVEPRARSDENAAGEVVRAIITIGRAGVRVIAIVTVGADRCRADVSRAHSNAHKDSLSVGERRQT
jgi:hypothetical protein